jgi:hypothetical protein
MLVSQRVLDLVLLAAAAPDSDDGISVSEPAKEPASGQPVQAAPGEAASSIDPSETIKFQGSGSKAELIVALLLGATLVYLVRTRTKAWR